jgi:hypothetical protein
VDYIYIYISYILYVHIVYVNNATGCTPQRQHLLNLNLLVENSSSALATASVTAVTALIICETNS